MSERKYTREQEELFEKIDEILLQNQSLKLSGLSEYDLTIYEEINEKDNDHITQSEALSYIKKIYPLDKLIPTLKKYLKINNYILIIMN